MIKFSKITLLKGVLIFFLIALMILYLVRFFSSKEIDDFSPGIPCERNLLEKSDTLWIIPLFENKPISQNKEWCEEVLALNKTLGMHGVYHVYNEFGQERNMDYIEEGVQEFESCFGYRPEMFKAPQLSLTNQNREVLERDGFLIKGGANQFFHKVYHCNDEGIFSNRFIDLF